MKRILILKIILVFFIFSSQLAHSNEFDVGLSLSSWGSGIEGNYFYEDNIHFGGSYQSISRDIDSTGTTVSVKGEIKLATFELFSKYYFRQIEWTNGFFGQGGIALRNWKADADYTENSTGSKVASLEFKWNSFVLTSGLGWGKIWDNGFSFQTSIIGIWGGKREINYTENLYRISDSSKKDLEDSSNFSSKFKLFFGYSF